MGNATGSALSLPSGVDAVSRRWTDLRRIEDAYVDWLAGRDPPLEHRAKTLGLAAGLFAAMVTDVATYVLHGELNFVVFAAVCGLVFAVTSILVTQLSNAAPTHVEHLDRLLDAYEPQSKEAFQALLSSTRQRGKLCQHSVSDWIEQEKAALYDASKTDRPVRLIDKAI